MTPRYIDRNRKASMEPMMAVVRKNETVTFRMEPATLDVIQRAAGAAGKSVTAFVTEAAYAAARRELLDQRFVALDAESFDRVEALLAEPGRAHAALAAVLQAGHDWID
jgi:uncharacterized protein (DUF1778 family)